MEQGLKYEAVDDGWPGGDDENLLVVAQGLVVGAVRRRFAPPYPGQGQLPEGVDWRRRRQSRLTAALNETTAEVEFHPAGPEAADTGMVFDRTEVLKSAAADPHDLLQALKRKTTIALRGQPELAANAHPDFGPKQPEDSALTIGGAAMLGLIENELDPEVVEKLRLPRHQLAKMVSGGAGEQTLKPYRLAMALAEVLNLLAQSEN